MKVGKILLFIFLGFVGLFFIVGVAGMIFGSASKGNAIAAKDTASGPLYDTHKDQTKYVETVKSYIPMLTNYKPGERSTVDQIVIESAMLYAAASEATKNETSNNEELSTAAKEIKKKLSVIQQKEFPAMRKAYVKALANAMWENDIYVTVSGKRNDVIRFTGGLFASNKNIKEFLDVNDSKVWNSLKGFRFKSIQFCWYKGQDDYTYFDTKVPSDEKVVALEQL